MGKKGICYIVCAGDNYGLDFEPVDGDCVIAVDGGLKFLEQAGLTADWIIGDFDSLGYVPKGGNVIKLDTVKNDTDTFAAVKQGIKIGYTVFYIYCAVGGRVEHTIANIQLLTYLAKNRMRGFIFTKDSIMTAITDGGVKFLAGGEDFKCEEGGVSVLSVSDKCGVDIKGLKYELSGAVLSNDFPLGISNELIGQKGSITVRDGVALIVYPKKVVAEFFSGI